MAIAKNTICVLYDKDAEAAARFYAETFPTARSRRFTGRPPTILPARPATC